MTKKFGIMTDSGADFSLDYMKKHDLILIRTRIMIEETEYIDRDNITREEMVQRITRSLEFYEWKRADLPERKSMMSSYWKSGLYGVAFLISANIFTTVYQSAFG